MVNLSCRSDRAEKNLYLVLRCPACVYEVISSRGADLIKKLIPAGFLHCATIGDDEKLDVRLGWEVRITGVGPGKVKFA